MDDRVVVVTGGGSGIGAEIVRGYAGIVHGADFLDIAEADSRALVDKLEGAATFIKCDLTDIRALQAAFASIEAKTGRVHTLVNNAANDDRHKLEDVTPAYWEQRIAVNLRHQFFAAQAVAPDMRALRGGSIINLGSVSWMVKQGGMPVYTTSKAAIQGLTRSLARDLGPHGIRVNTLVPGWVMTERQLRMWVDETASRQIDENQCLPARLEPADIARMALFLAADDSRMCTAQDFIVDGGWT